MYIFYFFDFLLVYCNKLIWIQQRYGSLSIWSKALWRCCILKCFFSTKLLNVFRFNITLTPLPFLGLVKILETYPCSDALETGKITFCCINLSIFRPILFVSVSENYKDLGIWFWWTLVVIGRPWTVLSIDGSCAIVFQKSKPCFKLPA